MILTACMHHQVRLRESRDTQINKQAFVIAESTQQPCQSIGSEAYSGGGAEHRNKEAAKMITTGERPL